MEMKNMTTPNLRKAIGHSPLRRGFLLIPIVLACFGLSPIARAKQPSEDRGNGNSAAENVDALNLSTTASDNTAHGWFSLFSNTSGSSNTADGFQALYSNTSGDRNTATGAGTLLSNTIGNDNTANGLNALSSNTTGGANTAIGVEALFSNTTGNFNTATGLEALFGNTTGANNTANGLSALFNNTSGNYNTADGNAALFANLTGSENTAIGRNALSNNTLGDENIALGVFAGVNITGSNNIDIGSGGVSGESGTIRIGTLGTHTGTYVAGIFGETVPAGLPVLVDINGHLGTATSSARFKDDIKPMNKASKAILPLKPVTFHYKNDVKGTPQFGLIAEEVAEVNPDLVVCDKEGKPYAVRYDQVNAMLLNEFLKEHRKVEEQE